MRTELVKTGIDYEVKLKDRLTFADNAQFRKLIEDIKSAKAQTCVFDLSGLDMIDSSGLGMLMIAFDTSKTEGFELSVKSAHGPVKQLLALSKLDSLLKAA